MPVNVFLSYDFSDSQQVGALRSLLHDPNHPLAFHDRSPQAPVKGRRGKPLPYLPGDPRAKPVRKEIVRRLGQASRMVVLVGRSTHGSEWVKWEVVTFFEKKKQLQGPAATDRIIALYLKGCEGAPLPSALKGRSSQTMSWNPRALSRWLVSDLTSG